MRSRRSPTSRRRSGPSRCSTSSSGSPWSSCSIASSASPLKRSLMVTEHLLAGVMVVSLVIYVVLAGADFGGGVWDLLASGPRRAEQRALIEKAIGPVWEANHVWLILVVVVLFGSFPSAFAVISVALHVPLVLFLVGVVFRGSAFTFRAYDTRGDEAQ